MVRGREEGSKENDNLLPLPLICLGNKRYQTREQTRAKQVTWPINHHFITRKERTIERPQCAAMPSHPFITWKRRTIERSQCAAMHSYEQSSFYHMGEENNRTAPIRSHAQQRAVITCKIGLRQPIRLIGEVVP